MSTMKLPCGYCPKVLEKKDLKACSRCKAVEYCSVECHKAAWPSHKSQCKLLAERRALPRSANAIAGGQKKADTTRFWWRFVTPYWHFPIWSALKMLGSSSESLHLTHFAFIIIAEQRAHPTTLAGRFTVQDYAIHAFEYFSNTPGMADVARNLQEARKSWDDIENKVARQGGKVARVIVKLKYQNGGASTMTTQLNMPPLAVLGNGSLHTCPPTLAEIKDKLASEDADAELSAFNEGD